MKCVISLKGMVEKWEPVPGPQGPQYLKIPWTPGTPRASGPSDSVGPQDPWEITSIFSNSESKHNTVVLDLL